ncbi:MAG: hypothetical protein IPL25_13660 [Saprospiraceae bacterium]|nr:hypothetical protein [Candidatus Vicinibacter affinis]
MQRLIDHRMDDAIEFLQAKNQEGVWKLPSKHPGQTHFEMEQAGKPSRWNTLRANEGIETFQHPRCLKFNLHAMHKFEFRW